MQCSRQNGIIPTSATTSVGVVESAQPPIVEEVQEAVLKIERSECTLRLERQRVLEAAVRQRIESRLTGRLRNLVVRVTEEGVVLEGECATYYTKQLAQHAALGILEDDEHLENAIVVSVPR